MITVRGFCTGTSPGESARRLLAFFLCLVVFSLGCVKENADNLRSSGEGAYEFRRLLVLPFERREDMVCRSCRQSVLVCKVEPDAESSLNKLLMDRLRDVPGLELVSQEEVNRAVLDIAEPERTGLQLAPDFAFQVAKKVEADAVMRNFVFCYRERVGHAAAASSPAAVSFHLHLYRVDTGEMVWMGKYEEEQAALSENLLKAPDFFRRGAKWVKVDVLAQDGMLRAMKDFPAPRGSGP